MKTRTHRKWDSNGRPPASRPRAIQKLTLQNTQLPGLLWTEFQTSLLFRPPLCFYFLQTASKQRTVRAMKILQASKATKKRSVKILQVMKKRASKVMASKATKKRSNLQIKRKLLGSFCLICQKRTWYLKYAKQKMKKTFRGLRLFSAKQNWRF